MTIAYIEVVVVYSSATQDYIPAAVPSGAAQEAVPSGEAQEARYPAGSS